MSTGRAEAFSDGVFAIAITLLVLSLVVSGHGTLTSQLLAAWPRYFAYVVATLVAAYVSAVAAVIIFGLLAVYYLFDHLPSPEQGPESGPADSEG